MKTSRVYSRLPAIILILVATCLYAFQPSNLPDEKFITYTANPKTEHLNFYWKDDKGNILGSLGNLKNYLAAKHQKLVFAMNGGMYQQNQSPLGLYIENYHTVAKLNRANASGNFYLKPNGVFYISRDNRPVICRTEDFRSPSNIRTATQSGPMLVIDGRIHKEFKEGSANLNIRNGVGILPDGRILFAMSREPVNFYDFATYFKNKGCKNALYLDGFVSRTYLPSKNFIQTDGNFGVIVGVSTGQ